jgi:EmrB/QacA subfamily drug resistance transporter
MCLALVLVVAAVSAVNLALPELAVGLHATNAQLTWIADGYTVALAALVLPLGALGDRLGRRNVLIAGTVVFGLASLGSAMADSADLLILGRIVMGLGAAMIMPGTLSTITSTFPPDQRAKGVATWSGFASAGAVLGLLGAGSLLERWGWESIFVATAALSVLAGFAAWKLAPNTKEQADTPFDFGGSAALVLAIGAFVYAIIEGNESGFTEPAALSAILAAVVGTVAYLLIDLRKVDPILDPRLFALRGFRTGSLTIVVQFLAVFGFFFVGLQYLQLILGYGPLKSAIALLPVAAVVLPVSQTTPRLVARFGLAPVMSGGLGAMAIGTFTLSRLEASSGYVPFLLGLLVIGVGMGLTSSTGTSAIVGSLPLEQQGVASAMNDTTREVGSAIGIAVMGSVYGSHYRAALPEAPPMLPKAAVEAVQHSAAGGLEVAKRAGALGEPIAQAVRAAFMDGLSASLVVVSVVLAVTTLVVAIRAPRRVVQ